MFRTLLSPVAVRRGLMQRSIATQSVNAAEPAVPIVSHELPDSSCGTGCGTKAEAPRKKQIMQYTLKQLEAVLQEMKIEKFRAGQIFKWVYGRGARSFHEITELKQSLREQLEAEFDIISPEVSHISKSTDGTRKYLMKVHARPGKGDTVESVFIPGVGQPHFHDAHLPSENEHRYPTKRTSSPYIGRQRDEESAIAEMIANPDLWDRGSVCISSQIGCSLQCAFCHTGTMPKSQLRNLTAEELVGQVMLVKHDVGDYTLVPYDPHDIDHASGLPKGLIAQRQRGHTMHTPGSGQQLYKPVRSVTNIVLMGMGEPGYNYTNVRKALDVMMDPAGLALGKRRITLSTSGVVPVIEKLGEDSNVNLAISLHAVRNDIRDILVPINKQYPLEVLLEACRAYPGAKNNRVVTWEYVMLDGVNDTEQDAREMVQLLKGIPSLVNLIPFNPWPGSKFQCSSHARIKRFQEIVTDHPDNRGTIKCSVRTPRGRDILVSLFILSAFAFSSTFCVLTFDVSLHHLQAACGQLAVVKNAQQLDPALHATDVSVGTTTTNGNSVDEVVAAATAAPAYNGVKPVGVQNLPTAQEAALAELLAKRRAGATM